MHDWMLVEATAMCDQIVSRTSAMILLKNCSTGLR